MSRIYIAILLLAITSGCSDKQKEADRLAAEVKAMAASDSTKDTLAAAADTGVIDTQIVPPETTVESVPTSDAELAQNQTLDSPVSSPDTAAAQDTTPQATETPVDTAAISPGMPPRPADDGFVVQIASTVDANEAKETVARFVEFGYPAFPQAAQVEGTVWYRVRIGPYPTTREAGNVLAELNQKYQVSGWIAKHH